MHCFSCSWSVSSCLFLFLSLTCLFKRAKKRKKPCIQKDCCRWAVVKRLLLSVVFPVAIHVHDHLIFLPWIGATLDQTIFHSPLELVAIHAVPRFTAASAPCRGEKRKTSGNDLNDLASHHIMMSAPFVTLSGVAMCECNVRCQRKQR